MADGLVKIEEKLVHKDKGGGGKGLYLYIVKIGNFPEILMSSLTE